jgi:hypothetical protein
MSNKLHTFRQLTERSTPTGARGNDAIGLNHNTYAARSFGRSSNRSNVPRLDHVKRADNHANVLRTTS